MPKYEKNLRLLDKVPENKLIQLVEDLKDMDEPLIHSTFLPKKKVDDEDKIEGIDYDEEENEELKKIHEFKDFLALLLSTNKKERGATKDLAQEIGIVTSGKISPASFAQQMAKQISSLDDVNKKLKVMVLDVLLEKKHRADQDTDEDEEEDEDKAKEKLKEWKDASKKWRQIAKKLKPLLQGALESGKGDAVKMMATWKDAKKKANNGNYEAAMISLKALSEMIKNPTSAAPMSPKDALKAWSSAQNKALRLLDVYYRTVEIEYRDHKDLAKALNEITTIKKKLEGTPKNKPEALNMEEYVRKDSNITHICKTGKNIRTSLLVAVNQLKSAFR